MVAIVPVAGGGAGGGFLPGGGGEGTVGGLFLSGNRILGGAGIWLTGRVLVALGAVEKTDLRITLACVEELGKL